MNQSISGAILLFLAHGCISQTLLPSRYDLDKNFSDVYDGIFEARIAIPPDAIPGDYAFGTGQWEDIWGNYSTFGTPAGADNGGITIMNINVEGDSPEFSEFTASASTVDVTSATSNTDVFFTLRVTDASGIDEPIDQ